MQSDWRPVLREVRVAMSTPVLAHPSPDLTSYQELQVGEAPSNLGLVGAAPPPVAGGGVVVSAGGVVVAPSSEPPAGAELGAPPPTLPMVASSQSWESASVQPMRRLATSEA